MAAPLPLPALHATHAGIWLAGGAGEVREASRGEAIARAAETPHIILNAPLVGQRLGYPELSGLDLLELFAFIHPARFAMPTVAGLSRALGLEPQASEAGGGGEMGLLHGRVFEIAGVHISVVHGQFSEEFARQMPHTEAGAEFVALDKAVFADPAQAPQIVASVNALLDEKAPRFEQ